MMMELIKVFSFILMELLKLLLLKHMEEIKMLTCFKDSTSTLVMTPAHLYRIEDQYGRLICGVVKQELKLKYMMTITVVEIQHIGMIL
jgi:hypothetical protein